MENAKVYVDVLVNFDKDGTMSPVDFIWEDGEEYHVDRILARERLCYSIIELSFMHSTLYREI